MANILIVSNNPLLIKQWQITLVAEHQTFILNNTSIVQRFVQQQPATLMIIDDEILHSNAELLQLKSLGIKILIIGCNWAEDRQINILVAGIAGYCDNSAAVATLPSAVNSILQGDIWVQRHLVPRIIERLIQLNNVNTAATEPITTTRQSHLQILTHRELDVANMIRTGENNKTIAATLNISERTVKAHLTSIFQKLNVQDRLRLALLLKEIH